MSLKSDYFPTFPATRHQAVMITFLETRNAHDACPTSCVKWRYRATLRPYSRDTLRAMFGDAAWKNAVYFTSLKDSIDVAEEFVVYDLR